VLELMAKPILHSVRRGSRPVRAALIVAAYFFAFFILDLLSQQFEELRGVVAWYPPAGLSYALLLVLGVRFTPVVAIICFLSSIFIYDMPQPHYALLAWALIVASIYAAVAFLRHYTRFDWRLRRSGDVARLIGTAVLVSALLAVVSISSSALSSDMPRNEFLRAIVLWWIGETVGVLTITPFLLVHVMPWVQVRGGSGGHVAGAQGISAPGALRRWAGVQPRVCALLGLWRARSGGVPGRHRRWQTARRGPGPHLRGD
jgi:integral membrane sensor domain MASE1